MTPHCIDKMQICVEFLTMNIKMYRTVVKEEKWN